MGRNPRRAVAILRQSLGTAVVQCFRAITGLRRASRWSARVAEALHELRITVSDEHEYRFHSWSPLLLWRARSLLYKEPETISWIRGFTGSDVFFDIGANIGVYSIYAGRRAARVYAFEPEASNFAVLNRNIEINGLQKKITAFPLAISDEEKLDTLRLSATKPGAALHAFAENMDFRGRPFQPQFLQGAVSMTLDGLVYGRGLECPSHLKIDVDGLEPRIIRGAERLLADRRLRGILIEINELVQPSREITTELERVGFRVAGTGAWLEDPEGSMKVRNYVFERSAG